MNPTNTPTSQSSSAPLDAPAGARGGLGLDLLWLLAVWAAVYLIHLGTAEFRLEEPHRVEPAITMIESGHWAMPMISGEPYYRKPPLFNWMIAASFWLTGNVNEFTARLPSAGMMLLLAWTVYLTGRSWLGRHGAFGAGLILLTTVAMMDKGRLAEIETTYTALTGMACAVWLEGWARQRLSVGCWALTGTLLGLGLLAKGPPHLAFFFGLAFLCLGPSGSAREVRRGQFWLGVGCMGLPMLAWLWLVRDHLQAAPSVWVEQMTDRFTGSYTLRTLWRSLRTSFGSILNFMPWLVLAAGLTRRATWAGLPDVQRRFLWAAGWLALVTVVLLPAVPGYRARYSMPVYVPLLMALAVAGETLRADPAFSRTWRMLIGVTATLALAIGLMSPVVGGVAAIGPGLLGSAAAFGVLVWWRRSAGRDQPGLWQLSAAVALALALTALPVAMPKLAKRERARPAAARITAFLAPGESLYALRPGHVPFLFYLRERCQIVLKPENLPGRELVLLTTPAQAEELARHTGRAVRLLREESDFQILKVSAAPVAAVAPADNAR